MKISMAKETELYTYRDGKKVLLNQSDNKLSIRKKSKEELKALGYKKIERTSPSSYIVETDKKNLDAEIADLRKENVVHHAYSTADNKQEFLITDRVIVTFKQAPALDVLNKFMNEYSLVLLSKYTDKTFLFQLTSYTGMNPIKLVVLLTEKRTDLIEIAEHDLNMRMTKFSPGIELPTDAKYKRQWHLHTHFNDSQFDVRCSSRCEDAWKETGDFGSHDVVIGITDDGCKINHPDFASQNKFTSWGYFKNNRLVVHSDFDAHDSEMYESGSNHGTSCAGVIGGDMNGVYTVGAAPGCSLLPIKWQSNGPYLEISDSKLYTVLQYVSDKVDILSNSWGGAPNNVYSSAVVNYINQLSTSGGRRGKGILFLWAAGNNNCPLHFSGNQNIPYTDGWDENWNWIGVQSSKNFHCNIIDLPNVLHIGALASNAQRSHYSNYGTGVSLCAPTSNVHEYQRIQVSGLGIVTTTGEGSFVTNDFGGTSSATPLVAGIAALVISANPYLTAVEVASILKQTAHKNLDMTSYPKTPSAAYDLNPIWDVSPVSPFDNGGFNTNTPDGTWSPWFGHGRIDALTAVTEALQRKNVSNGPLKIISALVNPLDKDAGNEKVSLLNASINPVILNGIFIKVKEKKQALVGQINGGETLTVRMNNDVPLSNKGATIQLIDVNNKVLAEVAYTQHNVKAGEVVVF